MCLWLFLVAVLGDRDSPTMPPSGKYVIHLQLHGLFRGNPEIGHDADTGGQITYVYDLVAAQMKSDEYERVEVITRLIDDPSVSSDYGTTAEPLPSGAMIYRLSFGPAGYISKEALWAFNDEIDEPLRLHIEKAGRKPDFIHAHYADAGLAGVRICGLLGIPLAFTPHSLGRYRLRSMDHIKDDLREIFETRIQAEEIALAHATLTTVNSWHELQQLQEYENFDIGHCQVLSAGVDCEAFRPYKGEDLSTVKQALHKGGIQDVSRPTVLAAARLHHSKRLPAIVNAFASSKILTENCNLVFLLGAKQGNEKSPEQQVRKELQEAIQSNFSALRGKVACLEALPRKSVCEVFQWASKSHGVFVHAAKSEPFGLCLLEAAASGLPVVASLSGGPGQIIQSCNHGIAVDTMSNEALRHGMEAVLHEDCWRIFSQNGAVESRKKFSWRAHVNFLANALASETEETYSAKPFDADIILNQTTHVLEV